MRVKQRSLTFDDVLLMPAASEVLPGQVSLKTRLSRRISINMPLLSAAMDTVTESKLAIAIAQAGGVGVVHKNLSIEQQCLEVLKVKRYETGVLRDPVTIPPDLTVHEVLALGQQHKISGLPVIQNGQLLGIVTNRDLRFESELGRSVQDVMTPRERLVTLSEGQASLEEAKRLMHEHRLERVLVVSDQGNLVGLITAKDILKSIEHPNAAKDRQGRLLVGAAVGIGANTEQRAEALVDAGVDFLVLDTAHGHSAGVVSRLGWIKKHCPQVDVIAGNIATAEAARTLVGEGADALKVGIGPGSICTTRIVAGVGVPQITAISQVAEAIAGEDVALVADGGIRYSGDIAKAIAAGAHCIMIGGLFAGAEEAPGEVVLYQGRSYKSYRGMGSVSAMQEGAADRYFQESGGLAEKLVPEGIEGRVPYKGYISVILHQLLGGVRAAMGYCGCDTIEKMRTQAVFNEITASGMRESHVHDVQIIKEAPNYSSD